MVMAKDRKTMMTMREDGGSVSQTRDRTRQMEKMKDLSMMGEDDDGDQWTEHGPGIEHLL